MIFRRSEAPFLQGTPHLSFIYFIAFEFGSMRSQCRFRRLIWRGSTRQRWVQVSFGPSRTFDGEFSEIACRDCQNSQFALRFLSSSLPSALLHHPLNISPFFFSILLGQVGSCRWKLLKKKSKQRIWLGLFRSDVELATVVFFSLILESF